MLDNDEIILNILSTAQPDDKLLKHFHISYPEQRLAQENNCILVACVSSENQLDGFDFEQYRDLVEIIITSKKEDNRDALKIIKTVGYRICQLIMENMDLFPNKPVIRNINPHFESNLTLTRGQIMVNVKTEPVDFELTPDTIEDVCNILIEDIEVK